MYIHPRIDLLCSRKWWKIPTDVGRLLASENKSLILSNMFLLLLLFVAVEASNALTTMSSREIFRSH